MLLPLILIAWLAVFVMALALCRIAARGDSVPSPIIERHQRSTGGGLADREVPPEVAIHEGPPAASAPLTARGARQHRAPSAAGS